MDVWADLNPVGVFLAGCCNIHPIKQNGLLLLYGYINEQLKDHTLYKIMPQAIIELIFTQFCFDFNKLLAASYNVNDEWYIQTKSYEMDTHKPLTVTNIANFKQNIWESNSIIDIHTMRKIWKLKIIKCTTNKTSFEFNISISNIKDLTGTYAYEIDIANDNIEHTNMKLKNNDIISVVYVQRERISDYQWNGRIRFYVNNVLCAIQYDTDGMFCSDNYKLVVKLYDHAQIEMLH
eukprot:474535_1